MPYSMYHRDILGYTSAAFMNTISPLNNLTDFNKTSNVTTVTEVRSASTCLFFPVRGTWWVLLQHCIMLRLFFIPSVVSHTFSELCVYLKFGHHPHPLSYVCAKFHFFHGLHCWANPCRKIAFSLTQSLTQLIWCPGNRSACVLE